MFPIFRALSGTAIQEWIAHTRRTRGTLRSPMTNAPLQSADLVPNHNLKAQIAAPSRATLWASVQLKAGETKKDTIWTQNNVEHILQ